jgi:hypothetical protein
MAELPVVRPSVVEYVLSPRRRGKLLTFYSFSQLLDHAIPLKIYLVGVYNPFYVQKALLNSVSPKVALLAAQGPLQVTEEAFRIFVTWLLYGKLGSITQDSVKWINQTSLAHAWNFGAHHQLPAFQNSVMRTLVYLFSVQDVALASAKEAYLTTGRNNDMIKKVFVGQIAKDMCHEHVGYPERSEFEDCGLDKMPDFCLDLALELMWVSEESSGLEPVVDVESFLVDEKDGRVATHVYTNDEGYESLTDG